jgi:hypothetical protein
MRYNIVAGPQPRFAHFAVYLNDFWLLTTDMIQVNSSTESVPLTISYSPLQMWKWTMYTQMEVNANVLYDVWINHVVDFM